MIPSSVPMTLLLLRNSLISLYQSSNFIWSLSNYPGSGTMFFGIPTSLFTVSAGTVDISVSVCLSLLKASSVILRDPSCSDNASISFILLELVLSRPCSLHYTCFSSRQVTLSSIVLYASLLQGELVDTLPNVTTLS